MTLPDHLRRQIEQRVAAGQYPSPEAVMEAALQALGNAESARLDSVMRLRELIAEGEASEELDGETVLREFERELSAGSSR
jgi:putative addiction module CopG family antidote